MFVLLPNFQEDQGTARLREETGFVGCRDLNRLCLAVIVSVVETFPQFFFFFCSLAFILIFSTSVGLRGFGPGIACLLHGFVVIFIKFLDLRHGSIEMVSDFISTCSIFVHVFMSHYLVQSRTLLRFFASHLPDQVKEIGIFQYNATFSHRSDRIPLQLFVVEVSGLSERKLGGS
jgi:hypothetical protein